MCEANDFLFDSDFVLKGGLFSIRLVDVSEKESWYPGSTLILIHDHCKEVSTESQSQA